jgi:peptidoglycan/LPS O-acetylase OafA/YrhL
MYITEHDLLRKNNNFSALRHIATLTVFISHTYGVLGIGKYEPLSLLTEHRYVIGTFGLIIFFSMGGFLICRSLVTSPSIKQYLLNRFLRIWPAYAVNILFCILFIGIPFTTLPVLEFISHPQTRYFLLKNISLIGCTFYLPGVLNNEAVNSSTWTIPIEFRLYFIPLLVYLLSKLRFKQVLLLLLITLWLAQLLVPISWQQATFKPYILYSINLGVHFLTGACFYLYKDRIPLKLYIWLILFACWVAIHIWFPTIYRTTEQPFWAYTIMWMAFRWYKVPFMKADISYGVYLYAIPVQLIILHTIGQSFSFPVFFLLSLLCTIAVALLSWYLIEKKALSLKMFFKNKSPANAL